MIEQDQIETKGEGSAKGSSGSTSRKNRVKGLKKVVSGDFLMDGVVQKNLPFMLYITFLMLVYVAYGYYVNNSLKDLSREEIKSEELYSRLQSMMEVFDKESLQSKIAERVQVIDLVESKDPPRVIWIEKKEDN
jgi:hypothetical protein